MKRCPQCRRDYHDETLLYCLDDGGRLVDGPASDEPVTAIQKENLTEAPTREFSNSRDNQREGRASNRNSLIAGALGILLVTALGFGSYWYYSRGDTDAIDSIAVLPFENQSGNPDVDYLSDGMTETLINTLGQLPNLKVKPRSSSFRYKGREAEVQTIGRELNVRAILNGRLVQRGDDVTLFLALIDATDERHLWGKQYTRKLADLVTLQSDVARDISENLKAKLTGADRHTLAKNDTTNPEAYRLYLQGRFFWNKRRIGDMGKAIGFFQQAIDLDPTYARAYAGFADAVAQPSDVVRHAERAARSRAAALKALELDVNLAEAHTALAHILLRYDLDFAAAERELNRALELDPKWPDTYHRYGELYTALGRHDEALAMYRKGLKVEPFNLPLNVAFGGAMAIARRYDESVAQLKIAIEMDPNHRNAHVALYTSYGLKGMYAEAVDHRVTALKIASQEEWAESIREGFAKNGWPGVVKAELERFEIVERTFDRLPYYNEAHLLASIGEKDKAFSSLAKSVENQEQPALVFMKVDPRLDPLRDDPRFQELLKKVGLSE